MELPNTALTYDSQETKAVLTPIDEPKNQLQQLWGITERDTLFPVMLQESVLELDIQSS